MADEVVTIPKAEYDALIRILAAVDQAYLLQTGSGWVEALDSVWSARGTYYREFPARRPAR